MISDGAGNSETGMIRVAYDGPGTAAPTADDITVTVNRGALATLDFDTAITDSDTNFAGFTVTFRTTGVGVTGPGDILDQGTFSTTVTGTSTIRTVTTETVTFTPGNHAELGTYVFPYFVIDGANNDDASVRMTIVDTTSPTTMDIPIAASPSTPTHAIDFTDFITDNSLTSAWTITVTYDSTADRDFFPFRSADTTAVAGTALSFTLDNFQTQLERNGAPTADATILINYMISDGAGNSETGMITVNYDGPGTAAPTANDITVTVNRGALATLDFDTAITDSDTNFAGFTVTFRTTGAGVTGGNIVNQGDFSTTVTGTGTTRTVTTQTVTFTPGNGAELGTYVFPYFVTDGTNTDDAVVRMTIVDITDPTTQRIDLSASPSISTHAIDFTDFITDNSLSSAWTITVTYNSAADRDFFPLRSADTTAVVGNALSFTLDNFQTQLERNGAPTADATILINYMISDGAGNSETGMIRVSYDGPGTGPIPISVDNVTYEHIFGATRLTFTKIFTADEFEMLINSGSNSLTDAQAAAATVSITNSIGTTHPTSSPPTDSVATIERGTDGLVLLRYSPAMQTLPFTETFTYEVTANARTGTGEFTFDVISAMCNVSTSGSSLGNIGNLYPGQTSNEVPASLTNTSNIPIFATITAADWMSVPTPPATAVSVMSAGATAYSSTTGDFSSKQALTSIPQDLVSPALSEPLNFFLQTEVTLTDPDYRGAISQSITVGFSCN